jgi:hypothetical protein
MVITLEGGADMIRDDRQKSKHEASGYENFLRGGQ